MGALHMPTPPQSFSGPIKPGGLFVPLVFLELLPTLKDSEFRVLLVVLAQTLGWQNENGIGRKERDWISHSRFKQQTGRSSQAISDAIDVLVRRNLIQVTTVAGEVLVSKADRRRSHTKVFYGLAPSFLEAIYTANPWFKNYPQATLDSRNRKVETTKQITKKNINREGGLFVPPNPRQQTPAIRIHRGWESAGSVIRRKEGK